MPEQQTKMLRHPLNVPGSWFLGDGNGLVRLCSNRDALAPLLFGNTWELSDNQSPPDNLVHLYLSRGPKGGDARKVLSLRNWWKVPEPVIIRAGLEWKST
ncbi:hypothetical protein GRJ2_002966100 [Grus japonensis]|uniref:Uncharacterized protein n=1 Tax=Grus japonensis TaxID=30415 RepID=A0ABC9Y6V3_GRUJA